MSSIKLCNNHSAITTTLVLEQPSNQYQNVSILDLLELRWRVATTGAIRHAKLQLNRHHSPPTNQRQLLQAGYLSCPPTNSVRSNNNNNTSICKAHNVSIRAESEAPRGKGEKSHSMDLLTPSSSGVFQPSL